MFATLNEAYTFNSPFTNKPLFVIPPHFFQVEECGVATRRQPVIQVVRCWQTLPLIAYEYVVLTCHIF